MLNIAIYGIFRCRGRDRGFFHNAQVDIPIRHILEALGHPQPPTPLKTDNSTANGFVHNSIHQKLSKSWDLKYYWFRDRVTQQKFKIYWDKGINNWAYYFTKHHPTKYHRAIRARYVQDHRDEQSGVKDYLPFSCHVYCKGVLLST